MTDYDKLAHRIVALGIGERRKVEAGHHKWFLYSGDQTAEQFCNDGRVVLALMEKVNAYWHLNIRIMGHWHIKIYHSHGSHDETEWTLLADAHGDFLAIAICEACCEALEYADEEQT